VSLCISYLSQLAPQKSVVTLRTAANMSDIQVPTGKNILLRAAWMYYAARWHVRHWFQQRPVHSTAHPNVRVHTSHNWRDKFSPLPTVILSTQLTLITTNDTFKISGLKGSEHSDPIFWAVISRRLSSTCRFENGRCHSPGDHNTGHTHTNGAVLIVFTIKTAPFFCVWPV
jgi:hypothetical protein